MGYKIRAFKGTSWMWSLRGAIRGITFVRLAILARILTPLQFGVFGIATLILELLEIITETGINIVLIQKGEDSRKYINSAWVVSIIRGFLIGLLLVIFAPFISNFFRSPDSYRIVILIAIVPVLRGFINPSIVNNLKDIQFHKEFYLRSFLFLIESVVAITVAVITKNAVSLVYGMIISAIVEVILSFIYFKPRPKLIFEFDKVKHVISHGWWVTITGIFNYVGDNGDNIAVGKIMNTTSLGLYQMAYNISTLPITEITSVVNTVIFPVYTRFSDDKKRLLLAFSKVTILSSILALFLSLFVFIFTEPLIHVVLGDKWLSIIPVVRILSIYGFIRTVFGNFAPLVYSLGKQDYLAKTTFLRCIGLAITIVPFTLRWGMIGAGVSVLVSMFFEIPLIFYYLFKIFRVKQSQV